MTWFCRGAKQPIGPDYSRVDSRDKAAQLVRKGELVPILLLPKIFGGNEDNANVVFVPPFVADLKKSADENLVRPLVAEGKITRYSAEPVYSGRSFVPTALVLHAYDPADFSHRIVIWGDAELTSPS